MVDPGVAVLTIGLHVPVIPFKDVPGKTGADAPWQTGAIDEKAGIVGAMIVIFFVAVVAHCPASGVKV